MKKSLAKVRNFLVLENVAAIQLYSGWAFFGLLTGERGGAKKHLLHKICHTYPTKLKLGTVMPYLKKIKKIYQSCDTHPDLC